nr:hypothetical protein [Acidobacteriota bacterium]
MPAEEWRGVIYVLAELARWEAQGLIGSEQAAALRQQYERRREELRPSLAPTEGDKRAVTQSPLEAQAPQADVQQPRARQTAGDASHARATQAAIEPDDAVATAFSKFLSTSASPGEPFVQRPRRSPIETLTDPRTLRLLLYTGAAMLVVGVVIWLRDVLYLKLREPIVQAALLACGTFAVTASGWYTILRTRQRLTGRALTLIGSVLVPVNFWFLVRSGLISNNGRAWVVCAFCTLLYAHTAALLRERLYVYLACMASVATAWALVYRADHDAFGLYALTLIGASFVFLHLSRLFPFDQGVREEGA